MQILSLLARHKNQVISRETIIENLWPEETIPTYATIDVYVRRIRMALKLPDNPIQTVRGFGYVLKDKAIKPYRYSAERT